MMVNKCRLIVVLLAAVSTTAVQALEPLRPETVTTRERPELDPLGIRAGAFWFYPAVTLEGVHDDNIYATDNDEESDFITHLRPELAIQSDWGRHELNFIAGSDIGRYNDNTDEDYEDYLVSLDGRLDVHERNNLAGRAGFAHEHESRDSPDDSARFGRDPTTYDTSSLSAAYRHRFNRLALRVGGTFDRIDYDNVTALDGSTIDNGDRDRDVSALLAQLNYELVPDYSAFLRTRYKDISYDQKYDNNGLQRSSDGYEIDVGTELFLSGVMFGEVFIGYIDRNYDDSSLKDIDDFTGGAALTWLPSGLTTVTFAVERDIAETIVGDTSGILETQGSVEVDHELLRNLLLNARVVARDEDFEGTSRNDDYLGIGLGAKYMMNRNLYLNMGYTYLDRDSNADGEDFTDNRVMVGIRGQL